jgi:hypothetical protein
MNSKKKALLVGDIDFIGHSLPLKSKQDYEPIRVIKNI